MVNLSYSHLSGEDIEDKELIYPIPYTSSKEMHKILVEFSKQAEYASEEKLSIAKKSVSIS